MKLFKRFGSYSIFVKCWNCGANINIKIPKGTAVKDFIKGGKCECDVCGVVFFPEEYTTEYFEKDKLIKENQDKEVKAIKKLIKPLPKERFNERIKW